MKISFSIFFLITFSIAIFSFVSIFYPRWDVRWGSRGVERNKKAPVSVHGRIFFACFSGYFACWAILVSFLPVLVSEMLMVLVLPFLFVGNILHSRDRDRFERGLRKDTLQRLRGEWLAVEAEEREAKLHGEVEKRE